MKFVFMKKLREHGNRLCLLSLGSQILTTNLLPQNMKIKIDRNVFLCIVLNKCVTWSFTVWEEHRLTVLRNTVAKNALRPKCAGLIGVSKKRPNEDLPDRNID